MLAAERQGVVDVRMLLQSANDRGQLDGLGTRADDREYALALHTDRNRFSACSIWNDIVSARASQLLARAVARRRSRSAVEFSYSALPIKTMNSSSPDATYARSW